MDKKKQIEKLDSIVPKYFKGDYTYVGYVENIYGEPFIIFKVPEVKDFLVTGSELDWEVAEFEKNHRWFSEGDERAKIMNTIWEYEYKKDNN